MKIGWLVWEFDGDEHPTFYVDGAEPEWGVKRIRIVYAEVVEESK
jgi:hypothetical protein